MAVDIQRRYDKDTGKTLTYVTDLEKRKEPFIIIPHRKGYAGYEIFVHIGEVPKAISGQYVRISDAERAVTDHLNQMVPTRAVKRDADAAEREARKKEET